MSIFLQKHITFTITKSLVAMIPPIRPPKLNSFIITIIIFNNIKNNDK